jgi:hypothetical protein
LIKPVIPLCGAKRTRLIVELAINSETMVQSIHVTIDVQKIDFLLNDISLLKFGCIEVFEW